MTAPLASVVVNNHNYERFLREAVDSALAQRYPHTEVVVVDDGSTDGSREVLESYRGRIRPVYKENGGQASAFNAGFAASRGEVVLFLDADDVLLPGAVGTAVEELSAGNAVKVHWRLWAIDEKGRRTGRQYPSQPVTGGDLLERVLRQGPNSYVSPPTSGNAWTRRYLEQVLPAPEGRDRHGADAYLSMLAPLFGPVRVVREPQSLYRVHGDNFSGRSVLDRVRHDLGRYEEACAVMGEVLRRTGVELAPQAWKGPGTVYAWMRGVLDGLAEVTALVPPGAPFVLVDDGQWGSGGVHEGRRSLPFLERDGQYWGPPSDDETALRELGRMRELGATHLAFASPSFWWLDHYAGLRRHLEERARRVLANERVIVFDLRACAGGPR